jgi:Ni/Co efflux regulator RcnB
MKKLLAILIAAAVAGTSLTAVAADKKPVTKEVKKVKKHKKAESTGKVADDKPKKVTPKK